MKKQQMQEEELDEDDFVQNLSSGSGASEEDAMMDELEKKME